jgi:hypothetical protein
VYGLSGDIGDGPFGERRSNDAMLFKLLALVVMRLADDALETELCGMGASRGVGDPREMPLMSRLRNMSLARGITPSSGGEDARRF